MKKQSKCRGINCDLYKKLDEEGLYCDTRYYGLFFGKNKNGQQVVKIDPKRFQKISYESLSEEQLKVINSRRTHYFYPAKYYYDDYNCNIFMEEICQLKKYWNKQFCPMIKSELEKMEKPKELPPGDYDNYTSGISSSGSAVAWAIFNNYRNECEYKYNRSSLALDMYAQFVHVMASRIEATIVKVLSKNNAMGDKFDRNVLYATAVGKDKKVQELEHFNYYDQLCCIWNFVKHNSQSTYNTLVERYPEIVESEEGYEQGNNAIYYVKFSEELIENLLDGCGEFLKEYCKLVFKEDYQKAQWNYAWYFIKRVNDEIEDIENPLGLQWWDSID
jgi:hypothetical protein